MTERVNLVDAYGNRSVIAKMVNMEERISGAESSIEQTVKDGETSIDTKVDTGVTKINSLLTGLDTTIAKAEAAAATAETASTKAETAAKSVDEDIVAANNAVIDAQGYATTGKLHDGTVVTSADNIAKSCQTYADTASKAATNASTSATAAAASQTTAGQMAASAEASAQNASTYLDTVKASADAATASAAAAAQSAVDAQAIADSMDVSNMVTIADAQTITGAKNLSSASNTINVANRSSSAVSTNVINFNDINEVTGKYNNLVHRSGSDEPIAGFKICDSTWTCANTNRQMTGQTTWAYCYGLKANTKGTQLWKLRFDTDFGEFTILVSFVNKELIATTITGLSYEIIDNKLRGNIEAITLGITDGDTTMTIGVALGGPVTFRYALTGLYLTYIPTGGTENRTYLYTNAFKSTKKYATYTISIPVAAPTLTEVA